MSTTYSESIGLKKFNWRAELRDPPVDSSPEHKNLIKLARNWPTCACGNLNANIPRKLNGAPIDDELAGLGVEFFCCVEDALWRDALAVLDLLEARETFLLLDA